MKLVYSPASPYARKAVIVAIENGLDDRLESVPMSVSPSVPNRAFAAMNPLMKVPALVRDDGSMLYDSAVICEYLDSLGGARVFPAAGEARWQALRRHALADGVMDAAILARYETVMRPEQLRWSEYLDSQYAKIDSALDAFEGEVDPLSTRFDIGDIGLAAALGYLDFRFPGRAWRPQRPRLARWLARIAERVSFSRSQPSG